MELINFKFFIEHDSNPFILFNSLGKIKYLNTSAEVLMGSCSSKEIFNIALAHAPKSFGSKKSILNLNFSSFQFYGINILYENEEFLSIHLYNKPLEQTNQEMVLDGFSPTDINMLLQANIELFDMSYTGEISLFTDYYIPEFQIHQNNFSLLLRLLFSAFFKSEKLDISIKIKLGEMVLIKGKKYPIIILELKGNIRENEKDEKLKKLALKNFINLHIAVNSLTLEIPAIV